MVAVEEISLVIHWRIHLLTTEQLDSVVWAALFFVVVATHTQHQGDKTVWHDLGKRQTPSSPLPSFSLSRHIYH